MNSLSNISFSVDVMLGLAFALYSISTNNNTIIIEKCKMSICLYPVGTTIDYHLSIIQ